MITSGSPSVKPLVRGTKLAWSEPISFSSSSNSLLLSRIENREGDTPVPRNAYLERFSSRQIPQVLKETGQKLLVMPLFVGALTKGERKETAYD